MFFSLFNFCALNRCQHGESMAHQQRLITEWKGRYITVLNQNEDLWVAVQQAKFSVSDLHVILILRNFMPQKAMRLLHNRSKGHGSGCTTALSGMHRHLNHVYCRTPPTSLCMDNTQTLHRSAVEQIPKQYPHPRSKVNLLENVVSTANNTWISVNNGK